jgi:ParB family transcriptional regulator, chromosome partitioning protein
MDLQVPLNRLKFGHEDGGGINARVTGREDGIAALAANIHANGQIENLIVKDAGGGFYAVANGNRRLAAFHMIYGTESNQPINCTLHDVDETKGFEFSLTTAVTAEQLHPVDQYEGFARLKHRGQSDEEIARKYGLSEHEVEQALALGALSPAVRDVWRKGEIKASVAKAFTLADDHAAQDQVLAGFRENKFRNLRDFNEDDVKALLKTGFGDAGRLVEFIGFDAYVAAGGKVTRDLFGIDHKVSDVKLAKKLADRKLAEECERLKKEGWSFAATGASNKWQYSEISKASEPTAEEKERLAAFKAVFEPERNDYGDVVFNELPATQQKAYLAHRAFEDEIARRVYTQAMMEKSGCFVGIDANGMLEVEYGRVKAAAKVAKEERASKKKADAKAAKAEGKPAPEPKELSNALKERLTAQLVAATRDAIAGDPLLRESSFAEVLARTICAQIDPDRPFSMPDAVRTKLPSIRQVCDAAVFNAAIGKRFDAENYFSTAPKGFVLKAISEAINPDESRKIAGKSKPEIWKFALANIPRTGWLPKELRTVHYKGPGSEGHKRPAAAAQVATAAVPATPSTREAAKKAKQQPTEKAAARAAKVHARKAGAKKASAKKKR